LKSIYRLVEPRQTTKSGVKEYAWKK